LGDSVGPIEWTSHIVISTCDRADPDGTHFKASSYDKATLDKFSSHYQDLSVNAMT